MGWQTDDGQHEGAALSEFADGALSGQYGPGTEVTVSEYGDGRRAEVAADVREGSEVVGWRTWCSCGWRGQYFDRVRAQDRAARIAFEGEVGSADLEDSPIAPEWVEDAVFVEWRSHIGPVEELEELASASRAVADASRRLDEAVSRARQAGASWSAIGPRVGLTRQAAHARWAGR